MPNESVKMLILIAVSVVAIARAWADPASDQLLCFKNMTMGPIGILTTDSGAPVDYSDTFTLNSPLLTNELFMVTALHVSRERLPDRIVHSKGSGAFGYFEVTHNVTGVCKAKFLNKIGKKTPVVVRFSPSSTTKGAFDTTIDSRGFAVKFKTEEGNFDIAGFHTPMFTIKDPALFHSIARLTNRNPVTNIFDNKMLWDFISQRPESVFLFLYLFSDFGIPDGFRHMPGFSIHTYQIYNDYGESYYAKFHWLPDAGIKNLFREEAGRIALQDPDYYTRDLYNAIAQCNYPTWTVYMQLLTAEDVKNAEFDVFDITKILPEDKYPLRPFGKLVLNRNPKNFFADVEQTAFCPGNLVPGILGGPDHVFTARRLVYADAQRYRLGVNFNKIRVNCPLNQVFSYDRGGVPPVGYDGNDAPNYLHNSYNGPKPYVDKNRPTLRSVTHDDSLNYDQAAVFYAELPEDHKGRMTASFGESLSMADLHVQKKTLKTLYEINTDLGARIEAVLARLNAATKNYPIP